METETRELKVWETYLVYMFLTLLTVTSIVLLIFYFSGVYKVGHSRNDRFTLGFIVAVVICLILSAIATWRAHAKPKDEDEEEAEDEEEVEGEEE